jgi:hypothetical protein
LKTLIARLGVLVALALSACGSSNECAPGTLFVTLQLDDTARGADQLDVSVLVAGGQPRTTTLRRSGAKPSDTFEVAFPAGYPAGKRIDVGVVAKKDGKMVGSAQGALTEAAAGCSALALAIMKADGGSLIDVNVADGAAGSGAGGNGGNGGNGGTTGNAAGADGGAAGSVGAGGSDGGAAGSASDGGAAGTDGAAGSAPDAGPRCQIAGATFTPDAPNPANACQSCQPAKSATAWSDLETGTSCGTGKYCNAGACAAGCLIAGAFRAADAPNPANACQSCQPAKSATAWSNVADGASCGNGQICGNGACGTQCVIAGAVFASGAANPANACQICQPGTSTTAWTAACAWQSGAFAACSTTCGAGTQTRPVTCVAASGATIADALCTGTKPAATQACNATTGCSWQTSAYGACSKTCGAGVQTRTVTCVGPGAAPVDDAFCTAVRPVNSQSCIGKTTCGWVAGTWSGCSARCGSGTMTRSVTCMDGAGGTMPDTYCLTTRPTASQSCSGPVCVVYVLGHPTAANGPCYMPGCTGPTPSFPACPAGYAATRSETACGNPNECNGNWALCTFAREARYGCSASGYNMPVAVRECTYQ